MAAHVTIVSGPARSGKTARLLVDYRRVLAAGLPGCALWLAPNRRAANAIGEQLLDSTLRYCASPQCITFAQLGQLVLDASPAPLRPLTELMKRRLLRSLIDRGLD